MTVVKCPYCGASVVAIDAQAGPLPRLREGFIGPELEVLGFRPGDHSCLGYDLAGRIYSHAGAER